MSSLWDEFAQKIYSGSVNIEEFIDLIAFLKDFDNVHGDILKRIMITQLRLINYQFTDWDMFEIYLKTGSVHRRVLEYFIGALHDFDHSNEQVLMYTYEPKKRYWKTHNQFKTWMGVFKDGVWTYSKKWKDCSQRGG